MPDPTQPTAAACPAPADRRVMRAWPTTVWASAQRSAAAQRRGRYLPASLAHPGKMLPAIAAHAIAHYSAPGELVCDPMCGIGTTLVEAVHLGRHAVGVEYEHRWADLSQANLSHARRRGAAGTGRVVRGDARHLPALLGHAHPGQVALVVTSPPYGASVHGHVQAGAGRGIAKSDDRYGTDPGNLAHRRPEELLAGFTAILAGCLPLLRPGGIVVVTARPWRRHGELVDLPSAVLRAGAAAGLTPIERCVALLAGLRGERLVPRPSFFQLDAVVAQQQGQPAGPTTKRSQRRRR